MFVEVGGLAAAPVMSSKSPRSPRRSVQQVLLYALLGLGSGALIAGIALGVVLTYRGSGIINLATGGFAMFAGYAFWALRIDLLHVDRAGAAAQPGVRAGGSARRPSWSRSGRCATPRRWPSSSRRSACCWCSRRRCCSRSAAHRAARTERTAAEHRHDARRGDPDRPVHPHRDRDRRWRRRWRRSTGSRGSGWRPGRRRRTRSRRCSAGCRRTRCRWSTRCSPR